jgi:phosphoserine phosphatase RsbU/P
MPARPKVLLVDDEPFNLDYLAQELEDHEVEILTAASGPEALDAAQQYRPDMIFLDIMMPGMDGFAVLQRLKADPRSNAIPVVIISAANDLASVVKGIELGAEDFLPKPFNPVLVQARLNAGLEKKRLYDIERRYVQSLERELEIGREIQAGFLPQTIPQPPGWEIAAVFRPAREVAGDFYDVFELENSRLGLLIGDVTDKGVGAALFMALFRSLLRATMMMGTLSDSAPTPEQRLQPVVNLVNRYICQVHASPLYATLFFGVLDTHSGLLTYVNAGQDVPYVLRDGAIHEKLRATGMLVGAIEHAEYRCATLTLERGDALVLYSDGITDAQDSTGAPFEQVRWQELLRQPVPASRQRIEHLIDTIIAHMGSAPQYDDISLVTVRRA